MEPEPTNGVITAYTVFCRDNDTTESPDCMIFAMVEDTMTTVVQLTSLSAFTVYECYATDNTSAGEGDPSNTATTRTSEAGR